LLVIKTDTGDVMNFEMAREMAEGEGIKMAQVIVADDVAVRIAPDGRTPRHRRTIFVHKIAGAKAEMGADLEDVRCVAQRVCDNVRSMGVAIEPCIVPANGKPGFELADDEMEVGTHSR